MQKQPDFEAIELRDKYELSVIVAKVGMFAYVIHWLALSIGGIPSALNVVLWNVLVLNFLFALFLIPPLIFHWFRCSGKARLPFWA
ncbi:MAG: hypothetical protein J0L72_02310 [Armatimonadetes bacterium]|nr:hypothetical protein [Armatimonadota bacterium]